MFCNDITEITKKFKILSTNNCFIFSSDFLTVSLKFTFISQLIKPRYCKNLNCIELKTELILM